MLILSLSILILTFQIFLTFANYSPEQSNFRIVAETKISTDEVEYFLKGYSSLFRTFQPFVYKNRTIDREGPSTFLVRGGIVEERNAIPLFLCKISVDKFCQSKYIADSIDLVISFNPLYTYFQDIQPLRYTTHFNFLEYVKSFGMKVQVTEAIIPSQGQRFKVTSPGKEPWEIQLTVDDLIYYRENLVNVAARKLKDKWEYLMMIDGHEFFENSYWWEEAIWKAEHYPTVQLFQKGYHFDGPHNKSIPRFELPAICYTSTVRSNLTYVTAYFGNAYVLRKDIYDQMGYIMDYCIAGGCDTSFFLASLNEEQIKDMYEDPFISRIGVYYQQFTEWIMKTRKIFKNQRAVIRGNMLHFYHEEVFDYQRLMILSNQPGFFDHNRDLDRDVNFTLYVKNTSKELAIKYEDICYGPHPNVMFVYNKFGDRHKQIMPFENMALMAGHYFLALVRYLI